MLFRTNRWKEMYCVSTATTCRTLRSLTLTQFVRSSPREGMAHVAGAKKKSRAMAHPKSRNRNRQSQSHTPFQYTRQPARFLARAPALQALLRRATPSTVGHCENYLRHPHSGGHLLVESGTPVKRKARRSMVTRRIL